MNIEYRDQAIDNIPKKFPTVFLHILYEVCSIHNGNRFRILKAFDSSEFKAEKILNSNTLGGIK